MTFFDCRRLLTTPIFRRRLYRVFFLNSATKKLISFPLDFSTRGSPPLLPPSDATEDIVASDLRNHESPERGDWLSGKLEI